MYGDMQECGLATLSIPNIHRYPPQPVHVLHLRPGGGAFGGWFGKYLSYLRRENQRLTGNGHGVRDGQTETGSEEGVKAR